MGPLLLLSALFVTVVLIAAANPHGVEPGAWLGPWASNHDRTDVPKQHVENIADRRHEYVVQQGGTMDGTNCRSPVGVYEAWEQTWESNRLVRMENVGTADLVNPWLSNGRNNFRTIDEIVDSATEPGMTDREKAIAIWRQETQHRYHYGGGDDEVKTPVKVLNVYGHNTCGDDSNCLAGLWKRAGLRVSPAHIMGHCVTQGYYNGGLHLLDGDMHSFYLERDNLTIASEIEIVRDHDLVKRTHCHGVRMKASRSTNEWEAALYVYDGVPGGDRDCIGHHTMNMTLRPGEALVWRWGHLDPVKYHAYTPPKFPDTIANGLWEYCPDLSGDLWRRGADVVEGIVAGDEGLRAEPGRTGTIAWTMRSPYVIVGGRIEADAHGARFAFSRDGEEWHTVSGSLDDLLPPDGPACYLYRLRCELPQGAVVRSLTIVNDIQMAPLALPDMRIGDNRFVYTDETEGERAVRITHEWVERSATRPPAAPAAQVYPPDGAEAEGTEITFRWQEAVDADGDAIADYHFQLSDRPDMRWPLSPNFDRLASTLPGGTQAQYELPEAGLLTPGMSYYWRVRAQDAHGVWGPWSETWSFTAQGPAYPVGVALDFDEERGVGTLRWEPNPVGQPPVRYRVYGSDEKGFSVSDEPYDVNVGDQEGKLPTPFPANLAAEVEGTRLPVLGADLGMPNANRAFYRVVAVDQAGNRSGPSDFVAAPRPFIHSKPVTEAKVGQEYRYQLHCTRSIGDLRSRGGLAMRFWDVEHPAYSLQAGPDWLKLDAQTGLLTGTPDAPGECEVVVAAAIRREARILNERVLSWGREQVDDVQTKLVGETAQRLTIAVRP